MVQRGWTRQGLLLDYFNRYQQIKLIGVFAISLVEGHFSGPAYDTLAPDTVQGAI